LILPSGRIVFANKLQRRQPTRLSLVALAAEELLLDKLLSER
jgi:hypothetical protein